METAEALLTTAAAAKKWTFAGKFPLPIGTTIRGTRTAVFARVGWAPPRHLAPSPLRAWVINAHARRWDRFEQMAGAEFRSLAKRHNCIRWM